MENIQKRLNFLVRYIIFVISETRKQTPLYFVYATILVLFQPVSVIIGAILPKTLLDGLADQQFRQTFFDVAWLSILLCIIQLLTRWAGMKKTILGLRLDTYWKSKLNTVIMTVDYEQLESPDTLQQYTFAKKCLNEIGVDQLFTIVSQIVSSILTMSGLIILLSELSPWVFLLLLSLVGFHTYCEIKRLSYHFERQQEESVIERNLYYARDYLTSKTFAKEVRLFSLYEFVSRKIVHFIDAFYLLQRKDAYKNVRLFGWTYAIGFVQRVAVYGYAAVQFITGHISIGMFSLFVNAMLQFSSTMQQMAESFVQLDRNQPYFRAVQHFLDLKTPDLEQNLPHRKFQNREQPTIVFEDVCFRYGGNTEYALYKFNCTIAPLEKISIVGHNGAGKTTLIKLLLRFYKPTSGRILFNGFDIWDIPYEEYIELFSAVFQDFNVYHYSISENITMGKDEHPTRILESLTKAGLAEKINTFKKKSETYIAQTFDDEGVELSGGEGQKLALARALYKDAFICILDEPTASLSPQSEAALYQKFNDMVQDKTAIYISHRLASCRFCNRILVLDQGKLLEEGTHEQLMKHKGLYTQMFLAQASHYTDAVMQGEDK